LRVLIAGAHGEAPGADGHELRGLVRKEEQTGGVEAAGAALEGLLVADHGLVRYLVPGD
jgi:hypothetical protein